MEAEQEIDQSVGTSDRFSDVVEALPLTQWFVAVNKEIVHEQKTCPVCGEKKLKEVKGIEVGNIFKLQTKFSTPFKFFYRDANDKEQPVIMGCYGLGPSRVMGTIVEVFHDDKGIIWPESIAPYQIHLVSLGKDAEVKEAVEKLYEKLTTEGKEVLFDDRDESAGTKLGDADLIGIPTRYLVSKKTLTEKSVEVKNRNEKEAELMPIAKL